MGFLHFFQNASFILICSLINLQPTSTTIVNKGKSIPCTNATITEIRIEGCSREPCTLKKGKKLPFEIDFSFESPESVDDISLSAMTSYWAVPPAFYGANLASRGPCKDTIGEENCPANPGQGYTYKSTLYADPKIEYRMGDKKKTTGHFYTNWLFVPGKTESGSKNEARSRCSFTVHINLTK